MSEFDPTAYRLTVSARDAIYEACCRNGRLVDVDPMIYDLAYRGATAAKYLLRMLDGKPTYLALGEGNRPLELPQDTELFNAPFHVRPPDDAIKVISDYRNALANNQLSATDRLAFSPDPQIILSRLIFIGLRARVVIERESHRPLLTISGINVPTRINTALAEHLIMRDMLSS